MPIHGEINTIAGGFFGGGCTASQRKKYARGVMTVEAQGLDLTLEPDLVFTKTDLRDVVPHDNNPVVISLVTTGRKMHHVLVDQRSSVDVMFWSTFNKLQLSPDQLRPYVGCLDGFAGDRVEVRGHRELQTTFTDGATSRIANIRYLVVNAPSAYNILLGRPALNRIKAVASSRHMKMKLPSLEGIVITMKYNQKEAKRCENSLKTKIGLCSVTTQPPREEEVAWEQRPEPVEGDRGQQFQVVDLVMQEDRPHQLENKLSPKWTGLFLMTEALRNRAYRLKTLEGGAIPRTWNATNLKFYFS